MLDKAQKSAVDYVMESSSAACARLLLDFGAKDANGHDVFQRATLENNAHLIQFFLSSNKGGKSSTGDASSDAKGWKSGNSMWLIRRGANAQASFCTCFTPAPCRELKVRYPLVFGKVFPNIKALLRYSSAGQVLEQYQRHAKDEKSKEIVKNNKHGTSMPELPKRGHDEKKTFTGIDGFDIFQGVVQCWICKQHHHGTESWVGPVALQLDIAGKSEGGGGGGDSGASGAGSAGGREGPQAPTLRLFMHHACCVGLEKFLVCQKRVLWNMRNSFTSILCPG